MIRRKLQSLAHAAREKEREIDKWHDAVTLALVASGCGALGIAVLVGTHTWMMTAAMTALAGLTLLSFATDEVCASLMSMPVPLEVLKQDQDAKLSDMAATTKLLEAKEVSPLWQA